MELLHTSINIIASVHCKIICVAEFLIYIYIYIMI
jgi:hypothetical protein